MQSAAAAANATVVNVNNLGAGSLRQAIADVPAGGSIDFAAGLGGLTITLTSELVVDKGVTIDASGLTAGLTIAGGGATRLFRVTTGGNLTLRNLAMTGGNGVGAAGSGFGGAIYNAATVAVERCTLSGNSSANYGGAIYNALFATLGVTNSTFTGNAASLYGGAISNSGHLTVNSSTLSGNTSGYEGGGVYSDFYGTLTLSNSTFTGNSANYYGGAIFNGSPLNMASATLAGNNANRIGGGIYNDYFGTLTLNSSIIAANTAPENTNIFGIWAGTHNFTNGDPKLAPPGNWGGPTQTMPPLPDSPVIDAGGSTSLVTDQRGLARVLGGGPDIGAFESAIADFNPNGLTIFARVPLADSAGVFEISADPAFLPVVGTLAGTGIAGFADDSRLAAKFGYPSGAAQDTLGNIFIADTGNNRIRMLEPDGTVTTIAGTGNYGLANGPGASAMFAFPSALAVGPDDNVYVADTYNHRICKLTRPALAGGSWTVTTLAGTGTAGFVEGTGAIARFHQPYGLTLDAAGNVYVADALNHRIRKVTPAGSVSTYAGSGIAGFLDSPDAGAACFDTPESVVFSGGNLFVADTLNHRIRRISTVADLAGTVATFAGSGVAGFKDDNGTAAKFNTPSGLAADGGGNLYVADEQNHRIRKITATGKVTTVAGTGSAALVNGNSTIARFNSPTGVLVALDGTLVVADAQNHVLRRTIVDPLAVASTLVTGSENASGVQVSAVLDVVALGLDPGTTYYFRWRSSTTGTTQPLGQSFFLYDFPAVVTEPASNLIPTSARLNASVDPRLSRTGVVFTYSTDPDLLPPHKVTTPAGTGVAGFANGNGSAARFSKPSGVVMDTNGDAIVADSENHRIRRITAAGEVTTFAGTGVAGFANGNGGTAQFEHPAGIAIDSGGNFYVADKSNHRIRRITPAGEVSTFAGSGVAGFADGAAATAKFLYPAGVAVDADDNVYVADSGNHRIRKITATSGTVTTLAGSGTAGFGDGAAAGAQFSSPQALAVGATGLVVLADTGNQRIRVIDSGNVYTLAGSGAEGFLDGPGTSAQFASPTGIAIDGDGVAYVADGGNHRIRRIATDGQVSTFAGSGIAGLEDSPAVGLYPVTACQFASPAGIAVDGSGGWFVTQEAALRRIARSTALPTLTATPDATGSGERIVSADITQPLFPGATYYFRATGTNYRGSTTGETLSFSCPQAGISVFDGAGTSAPALAHEQAAAVDFGSTPKGQPVTRYFTVSNPGGWPLTVSAVGVPTAYQLTGGTGIISPLGSLTFAVTLPATGGGSFTGGISITSNAAGLGVFTFPIAGEVLEPPAVSTLATSAAAAGTATFNATVNPMGSSTTVWFEWSLDPGFDGVMISRVAGSVAGYLEGTGSGAKFNQPSGVATDANGNIYVADTQNHRIRMIASDGSTSTFAGTGVAGFADGPAATAQFNQPVGLAMSGSGILFVADSQNHRIRAINPGGNVVTYAGLGTPGFTDGVASAARFRVPRGLAINGSGILYVADSENHRIRVVATDGSVSTLAGTGTAGSANGAGTVAQFNVPEGIATDAAGFVYVTEAAGHAIRRIGPDGFTGVFAGSAGVAGFADAVGTAARFSNPAGLAMGVGGILYVADRGNYRIRAVSPGGSVTTIAGSGTPGTIDGVGEAARFTSPFALTAADTGEVIVGESGNSIIRRMTSLQVVQQAASGLTGVADIAVQLPATGLPLAGTYFYRTIATNGGGTTIGNTRASTGGTFQMWQSVKFGANAGNPLIAGASACPAGDGVCNLLKYAFGLEPLVGAAAAVPAAEFSGGVATLTYTKVLTASDLVYTVEWSADLANWSPLGVTEQVLSGDGATQRILASVAAGPAKSRFMRLRVTLH